MEVPRSNTGGSQDAHEPLKVGPPKKAKKVHQPTQDNDGVRPRHTAQKRTDIGRPAGDTELVRSSELRMRTTARPKAGIKRPAAANDGDGGTGPDV
jgi:hypothetical protein